jgi:Tfp pilus assembly protein PilF
LAALKFYKESLLLGSGVEGLVKVAQLIPGASDKMSYYARALELGINDGSVYNAYGSYLTRIGRVEEAGEVFEKGLRVCTRDRLSLYHGNAKMLISVGDRERAEEILVKAIREGKEERTKNVVEGRR